MIIVKLQGGLGNQMFQYAAARALAIDETVQLDLSFLNKNQTSTDGFTARSYQLNVFRNLKASSRYQWFIKLLISRSSKLRFIKTLLPGRYQNIAFVNDDNFKNEVPNDLTIYLDGYFQHHKYYSAVRDRLLSEFRFPDLPTHIKKVADKITTSKTPVSIHVRRGDYLKPQVSEFHGVLDVGYYNRAIEIIEKNITNPNYFIFSDDMNWCEQNLGFINNAFFVPHGHADWIDMYLMTLCKHHVIANSSFSWWGAWLAGHVDEQIVIAPKQWFNPTMVNFNIDQIIPDSWMTIN